MEPPWLNAPGAVALNNCGVVCVWVGEGLGRWRRHITVFRPSWGEFRFGAQGPSN
jgi:hypothetical protein